MMTKDCKRYTIVQKNETRLYVVLDNVCYVPKLWYNLFSILEALKRIQSIGNKGMNITISKEDQQLNLADFPSALHDTLLE